MLIHQPNVVRVLSLLLAVGLLYASLQLHHSSLLHVLGLSDYPRLRMGSSVVLLIGSLFCFVQAAKLKIPVALKVLGVMIYALFFVLVVLVVSLNVKSHIASSGRDRAVLTIEDDGKVLRVEGFIGPDLPSRIASVYSAAKFSRIEIESLGGGVGPAFEIGGFVSSKRISVRANRRCASACVIVWASALEREAYRDTTLGFHKFHLVSGKASNLLFFGALGSREEDAYGLLENAGFSRIFLSEVRQLSASAVIWRTAPSLSREGVDVAIVDRVEQ